LRLVHGKITGPGNYERPIGWTGVDIGEGEIVEGGNQIITAVEALEKVISQLDSTIETAEKEGVPERAATAQTEIDVLPGFPDKIEGEILFLDADNISTDGIYPGMFFLKMLRWCLLPQPGPKYISSPALAYHLVSLTYYHTILRYWSRDADMR
jgi:hypothetical protein